MQSLFDPLRSPVDLHYLTENEYKSSEESPLLEMRLVYVDESPFYFQMAIGPQAAHREKRPITKLLARHPSQDQTRNGNGQQHVRTFPSTAAPPYQSYLTMC